VGAKYAIVDCLFVEGGKVAEDGRNVAPPGVVGCIASVVLNADYRLNWTITTALGSTAANVTECSLQ